MAAEGEDLLGFDGCGFLGVVISGDQGGAGKCLLLAWGEPEGGHFADAFGNLGEPVEDTDATFDDLALDVSLVGDADVVDEVLSYNHAVAADEAENSGHEAIRGCSIMGVKQDDLVVSAADLERLAVVAEADEVFSESAFVLFPATALHDGVRAEAFTGEARKNFARWDVFVSGGPAAVCAFGKYRGGNLAEAVRFDGSGAAGEINCAVAACPGESCNCHNMGSFLDSGVELGGGDGQANKCGGAEDECGGAAGGEGEGDAEGEAAARSGGECYRKDGFYFHFFVPGCAGPFFIFQIRWTVAGLLWLAWE